MRYRFIAFDVDGTLLDTAQADMMGLQEVFRSQLRIDLPVDALRSVLGVPSHDGLRMLGVPEADIDRLSHMWMLRMKAHFDTARVFPGMRASLDRLREMGARLGIVTSKNAVEYAQDMPPFDIEDCFCVIVTSSDTRLHKPNPEPLLECMRRAGVRPQDTLYIGDSRYDRDCARDAGVDFALAVWGSFEPDMEGARWRPRRPEDLLEIVRT